MIQRRIRTVFLAALFLAAISTTGTALAEQGARRFFIMGDGTLSIQNMKTGDQATVTMLKPDGSFDEAGLRRVDQVFQFPTDTKGEHISLRLLFMLDYFLDLVAPGKTIRMISAYRDPDYNGKLRDAGGNVAKTSTHMDGMALDFHIDGVNGKALWELVRARDCAGIGHYGGENVHMDSARPRFWEASTSKTKTNESDHNRKLYLSTEYDRYMRGESIRLFLASVSDFGFGVEPTVTLVREGEGDGAGVKAELRHDGKAQCVFLPDRKSTRFLYVTPPPDLKEGRYRVTVHFCRKPYPDMPDRTVSNPIEITGNSL